MAMDVKKTALLPASANNAALFLDRCARTISTIDLVLGANPRLGV
jgi:hypothetical protein